MTNFKGVQHVKFMLTVSHNDNSIIFVIDKEIKYTKNLNNVLNQNVNSTKRAGSKHFLQYRVDYS